MDSITARYVSDFDGDMPECLGKDCPISCCNEKEALRWGKSPVAFHTTLTNDTERQQYADEEIQKTITVKSHDIGMDRPYYALLVQNCLDDSGCRIADKKPLNCRIYPFKMNTHLSFDERCPKAHEIAKNPHTIERIHEIIRTLGYDESFLSAWESDRKNRLQKN